MNIDRLHNSSLEELDRGSFFHPFTSIADHQRGEPRIVASAQGVYVTDSKGRRCIDGAAGLWCVNVGYGRAEIVEAMARQASMLPFAHSFTGIANEPAIRLADRVLQWAPPGMSKVFFGNSGSDANDTNMKLVWYYNNLLGRPHKKKIISRERAYHGVTIGAGSLTGLTYCHDAFDLPLPQVIRTLSVDQYRGRPDGMSEAEFSTYLADQLEALILREDPETIAAFIAEPLMGTGGVLPPPDGYFPKIQAVLDRYDILMIADEVICGFGRLGADFGSSLYGIRPDIMTLAKGLSSGYQPISASVVGSRIWDVLVDNADKMASFSHGFTYSAHPVAAAAALANLDIIERENLVGAAKSAGEALKSALIAALGDHDLVGDIRGEGLMLGIELVADKATKRPFNPSLKASGRIVTLGYEEGVIVRPLTNVIAMSPPLTLSLDDIEVFVGGLRRAFDRAKDVLF
jgi:L-2,4-diaminobutyrate transaminase